MQFAILTAVLAALAAAQSEGPPVGGVAWRLVLALVATLAAPTIAFVGVSRLALSVPYARRSDAQSARLQSFVTLLWLGAVLIVLFVAQWPRIVQANWALAALPLIDDLAILAPLLISLLLIWTAFFQLERQGRLASCVDQIVSAPPGGLRRHLWFNTRHHLGLILVPPLIVVAVFDSLAALRLEIGPLDDAWWIAIPLLVTTLLLMPLAVRRIWPTTALPPGPLRELLESTFRQRNCSVREILVWNTDGSMANAAVVGISRWLRYVLLSDALLARLSPAEIAAVLRHEIAHLRRWHLPLRLALFLLPLAIWKAAQHCWPEFFVAPPAEAVRAAAWTDPLAALALPVAMLAYALVVVGRFSCFLELDADLSACLTEKGTLDPRLAADFRHALVVVCAGAQESRLGQWLHPPLKTRLHYLDRALIEGAAPPAMARVLHSSAIALAFAYLACALAFAW